MGNQGDRNHDGGHTRTVTVTATGEAVSRPDALTLSFGVWAVARTATEALARTSTATTALLIELEQAGIADADVQTSNLEVSPLFDHEHQTAGNPPRLAGYRAVNRLAVLVRGLERVGPLVDAAAAAAGDGFELYEAGFSVLDEADRESVARRDALARARDRARQLAMGLGAELGPVLQVVEGPGDTADPGLRRAGKFALGVPIAPGLASIQVTVTVTYELR